MYVKRTFLNFVALIEATRLAYARLDQTQSVPARGSNTGLTKIRRETTMGNKMLLNLVSD